MSIWCNNVVLNSSSLLWQLLLQQPPPWPCTPSAPAWVWRGTAYSPLACNTRHSAHYMILENNISSKLNMRKNMINCAHLRLWYVMPPPLWQTLLRTPNTLISLGLLLHNPRNRDKMWLCSPLIVIPSPIYQWSGPRLPDHRSQTVRHRNSSRRPLRLRRYHLCPDSAAADIASGSRITAIAT